MMLVAAFGASIGGLGTPIGTPPNLIGIGMLNRIAGIQISFFQWMLIGVPLVILLYGFLVTYFYFTLLRGVTLATGTSDRIAEELRRIGPLSPAQRNVLTAFGVTVALWLTARHPRHRGAGRLRVRARLRDGRAGSRRGHGRGRPAVPPAGELARPAVHADLGGSGPDRLGDRAAVRRRAGDGGAGVFDRPGGGARTWHHVVAARALIHRAHRPLYCRRRS